MTRSRRIACWIFAVVMVAGGARAGDDADAKQALKRAGRSLGHAIRDASKDVARGAKSAAREVDGATREPRQEVATESKGLWADVKQGFEDALESLSSAFEGTGSDSD